MIEIEIAFEYFDEGLSNTIGELQEAIKLYKDNYLVYYICCNNYFIFSNIEITKIEAETLVEFLESDKGLDMLYNEGIQTDYVKYTLLKKDQEKQEQKNGTKNILFERDLDKYVQNVEYLNRRNELEKRNELYQNKIKELEADNGIIMETKELLKEYQKLIKEKDKKINELKESNMQINKKLEKIPRVVRKIFIRKSKLLT